jgi:polyhydroxyalkanoate synthesis regulator phasin
VSNDNYGQVAVNAEILRLERLEKEFVNRQQDPLEALSEKVERLQREVAGLKARKPFDGTAVGQKMAEAVRGYCDKAFDDIHDRIDRLERRLDDMRERVRQIQTRPQLRFAGQFRDHDGKVFEPGDLVSSGGSLWACMKDTSTRPSMDNEFWQLAVRKGRDGKNAA